MALGSDDDDDGIDDEDDDHVDGSSGVSGDELFNRCINATLEAQEVRVAIDLVLRVTLPIDVPLLAAETRI